NRIEAMIKKPPILRELTWRNEEQHLNLPNSLRRYAAWLNDTAERIISPFSLRDQPRQVIRHLADHIKAAVGKKHIADLTALVRAGYKALKIDQDVDANALGKRVLRARQAFEQRRRSRAHQPKAPTMNKKL